LARIPRWKNRGFDFLQLGRDFNWEQKIACLSRANLCDRRAKQRQSDSITHVDAQSGKSGLLLVRHAKVRLRLCSRGRSHVRLDPLRREFQRADHDGNLIDKRLLQAAVPRTNVEMISARHDFLGEHDGRLELSAPQFDSPRLVCWLAFFVEKRQLRETT
jgi:hypothetical protein